MDIYVWYLHPLASGDMDVSCAIFFGDTGNAGKLFAGDVAAGHAKPDHEQVFLALLHVTGFFQGRDVKFIKAQGVPRYSG
jgi:hypothetical protein